MQKLTRLPDPHHFYANGIATRHGGPEGCAHCPLRKGHPVHDVKPIDADVKEAEDRRFGERA